MKKIGLRTQIAHGESSFRALFSSYQRSARIRGHEFTLTVEEFRQVVSNDCHYCGVEPSQVKRANRASFGNYTYNGVDRVDNAIGYIHGNVVASCAQCNRAKGAQSREAFLDWLTKAGAWCTK